MDGFISIYVTRNYETRRKQCPLEAQERLYIISLRRFFHSPQRSLEHRKKPTKRKRSSRTGEDKENMSKPLHNINQIEPDDEDPSLEIPTQAQLDAAIPAEITYRPIIDSIDARIHAPPNDGVWLCCNQHHEQENHIRHYQGDYPFKYLACRRCEHIYCSSCSSSEILTPLESLDKASLEERFDSLFDELFPERLLDEEDIEVRFFQLCRACGLTRRAIFEEAEFKVITTCPCGKTAVEEEKYLDFFIGSNRKYRNDGNALTQELRLTRIFTAHDRVVRERRAESRKNKSDRLDMDLDSQHLAPSTRPRDPDKVPDQGMEMK
jgi:hypothetical protein